MKDSIEKIISNDKKARKIVDEVSNFRQFKEQELKAQQIEIDKKLENKIDKKIEADKKAQWSKMESIIQQKKKSNEEISAQMTKRYEKNKKQWINNIYEAIVSE